MNFIFLKSLQLSDIILIFGALIISIIGLLIFLSAKKSLSRIIFALSLGFLSLYVISNFYIDFVRSSTFSLIWVKISSLSIIFFITHIYIFTKLFINRKKKHHLDNFWLIYLLSFFLSYLSFTKYVINDIDNSTFPVKVIHGEFYYAIIIYIVLLAILSLVNLFQSYSYAFSIEKYQIKYLLVGFFISLIIELIANFLLPLAGQNGYSRIGPTFIIVFAIMGGYALINNTLTDLNILLIRAIFACFTVTTYYITYSVLYLNLLKHDKNIYSPNSVIIALSAGALGLFTVHKIFFFEEKILRSFNRPQRLNINARMNEILTQNKPTDEIIKSIEDELETIFRAKRVHINLFNDKKNVKFSQIENVIVRDSLLVKQLKGEDFSKEESRDLLIMNKIKAELVFPLSLKHELLGQVIFYEKTIDAPYTNNEIEYLTRLTVVISIGLKRIMLLEEVKNFNKTLQMRVNYATKELRQQKKQLQDKYQFEKDMMGIMGHELRTPLTVAKGMLELVKSKVDQNTLDNVYAKDKIDKVYTSIIKEADLIQQMLSTSHVDNGKLNLQVSTVNVEEVIEYSYLAYKKDATTKGLTFKFIKPQFQVPLIESDQSRVQEIINNLVSNAIKYTDKGSVEISLSLNKDNIIVHVKDTGLGIPNSELENVGKKFYRIHQHLDDQKQIVRAGGTGLGLYVVKGILKALNGDLIVESIVNKGSTFSAVLPLKMEYTNNVIVTEKPIDKNDMFQQMGLNIK